MDDMKPLICQCCGGHIDKRTLKCPYCETQYNGKIEQVPRIIYGERSDYDTLRARVYVDERLYREHELAIKFAREKLKEKMLKSLDPYIEVVVREDPCSFRSCIDGRIKVKRLDGGLYE